MNTIINVLTIAFFIALVIAVIYLSVFFLHYLGFRGRTLNKLYWWFNLEKPKSEKERIVEELLEEMKNTATKLEEHVQYNKSLMKPYTKLVNNICKLQKIQHKIS